MSNQKSELIKYYFEKLALINDLYLRANPSTKDFLEVLSNPVKFEAWVIATELHRNGSRPWEDRIPNCSS
ncbi:hypothetical protein LC593_31490 [Nostoc sp. CHAB 5844]|nr:hypothetical protein [Nostoc sp. CHAB 5844]